MAAVSRIDRECQRLEREAEDAKLAACIWRDWQRARSRFLEYMGHSRKESNDIAKSELKILARHRPPTERK